MGLVQGFYSIQCGFQSSNMGIRGVFCLINGDIHDGVAGSTGWIEVLSYFNRFCLKGVRIYRVSMYIYMLLIESYIYIQY